jgi:hypothetical protein
MQHLKKWINLIKSTKITALESRPGDRQRIFSQFSEWGEALGLPVYVGAKGSKLQILKKGEQGLRWHSTTSEATIKLDLLDDIEKGIIILEGFIRSPTNLHLDLGLKIKRLFDNLRLLENKIHVILWEEDYIILPLEIQALIPLLQSPLPTQEEIHKQIQQWRETLNLSPDLSKKLTSACQGLSHGEIDLILERSQTSPDLSKDILQYKIEKLRNQGIEYLSQPDVSLTGGLDLLDRELKKIASLLDPEAQRLNLEFPKGLLLWGPPGTGKSLSAKLSAKRMQIPLIAADWGALLFAPTPDSALRNLLEITESIAPCILYWDDFDKGFSGWDSNANGGVSRRLAGRLLTWMQERTAPVFMLATVNRLGFLPPELIRRFEERIFFVDLPHKGARFEIFKIHLGKYFPNQFGEGQNPWSDDIWQKILREYNLTTPAEIGNAVRQTAERIFHRHKSKGEIPTTLEIRPIDLIEQRKLFTPAMVRDEEQIWAIRNNATYARPATGKDKSRFAEPPQELFGD